MGFVFCKASAGRFCYGKGPSGNPAKINPIDFVVFGREQGLICTIGEKLLSDSHKILQGSS